MMNNSNMRKAYAEVIEIIKHLSKKDQEKIPKEVIKNLIDNIDSEYKIKLKFDVPLDKQKMLYETKVILQIIHKNYLAKELERKIIEKQENEFFEKINFDNS